MHAFANQFAGKNEKPQKVKQINMDLDDEFLKEDEIENKEDGLFDTDFMFIAQDIIKRVLNDGVLPMFPVLCVVGCCFFY